MGEHEDNTWSDYDYHMNTGELTEYFEDENSDEYDECDFYEIDEEQDNYEMKAEHKDAFDALNERLDEIIIYLQQQIKEKEASNKVAKKNKNKEKKPTTKEDKTYNKTRTTSYIKLNTPKPIVKEETKPKKRCNDINGWKTAIILCLIAAIILFCSYLIFTV